MLALLRNWRDRGYQNIYGTDTIGQWCDRHVQKDSRSLSILDVGCGDGRDLLAAKAAIGPATHVELYGIECTPELIKGAQRHGVKTSQVDLECSKLPFHDGFFDVVMANQVLEHLKNWIWAFHELARVTKPGGVLIVGVPNLAAFHNRLLILFGRQPSCIKADGPHVRGFTHHELQRLARSASGLKMIDTGGTIVYGFPPAVGRRLGKAFPSLSATVLMAFRKTEQQADILGLLGPDARFETNFYVGEGAA
jgi:ubiquinone/menaquinone biosynthesis C-methylase UbiE